MKIYRRQLAGVGQKRKFESKVKPKTSLIYQLTEVTVEIYKIDLLTYKILRSNIGKAKSFLVFG